MDSSRMFPVRSHHGQLATYPYVVVRLGCSKCRRKGQYRLARLAAKYGSEIEMTALLAQLAGDCGLWDMRHRPGIERCGALFLDLAGGGPPNLPSAMKRPRLVG